MARRVKQTTAVMEMIKWMVKKKKRKVEKWSLQVEKGPHLRSSSVLVLVFLVVVRKARLQKIPRAPRQNPCTPLPRVPRQIPRTLRQIPRTPLERAAHE